MLDVAIMIEGQDGLTWPRWQHLAQIVESAGFTGLYRSDHYTNARPPDKDSLELWVSLTWLASHTHRIEFGSLVSPISFRHPSMTARMAAAVDDLSGGRLTLGLGAGWQAREHTNYGWDLLEIPERFDRFEEGLQVIASLLKSDRPLNYRGKYFQLKDAILLPRPQRPGGPPLLVGGNGINRTLPLAARYAQEWNGVYLNPSAFEERSRRLDELLTAQGRQPGELRRSLMTGVIYARDEIHLRQKIEFRSNSQQTPQDLRQRGLVVGNAAQIVEQLGQLSEAGVQRVMLQWLGLDQLDELEDLAQDVLPQIH
jgi:F420-dependent oxidoreductase-like protein